MGDGGDVPIVQDHLSKKDERDDDGDSNRSNSSRNKSDSPVGKKSSKRKRKNRRRREKKAAASVRGAAKLESVLGASKDEGTGTENEYSQNSGDVKDGEETETGTESETTCHDIELDQSMEISSVCVEPSLTTITSIPEDLGDSMMEIADYISSSGTNKEVGEPSASSRAKREPTHSVETLLQIAKCRILSRILEPLSSPEENDDSTNEGSFIIPQDLNSQEENVSSKLVVPPCSPSSLHSVVSSVHISK